MSIRTAPPFRADHVGSLLRPPELHAARDDFAAGRIDAEALRAAEDAAITDAVRLQEEVGMPSATPPGTASLGASASASSGNALRAA